MTTTRKANNSSSNLTEQLLTRKQIGYATERCRRIAQRKKSDLESQAFDLRRPELSDYDKVTLIRDGIVTLDVSRIKPDRSDRHYYAPRVVDCADFSQIENEILLHNKSIDKSLKKVQSSIDRRAAAILDRFELGQPSEALQLLTDFEAEDFSI